jgi:tetratricopeptide (TPR) repeat protein
MNLFASVVLLAWLPIVVLIFNTLPPKKAVASLFVTAWLFLPNGGFAIPGLPDYTKSTATVVGVLLCLVLFDLGRLLSIRPRWFDLPALIWCAGAFVTAIANGLTAYDAVAATMGELVSWGLPYLIGRAYLTDVDALKDLAEALVIGGLCYVPLCLIEVRLSPVLSGWVYGSGGWEGTRFGGFRPRVFLSHGLALGVWMMNASLMSWVLWSSGTIKTIRGVSFGKLMLALLVTTVLCKSTGATILLAIGMATYWVTMRIKRPLLIWLLVVISPLYCVTRTFELWSGQQVVEIARATVGEERGESFEYRLNMERLLADRALERPILGWGQYNRFQVTDAGGKTVTVPDGFWIIAFGTQGAIGLVCILSMLLLPMILTLRRFPVATWRDPKVGAVVALALILTMTMIDCLSNAMLMPIFPLAIGGILGLAPYRPGGDHGEAEEALAVASEFTGEGRMVEAGQEFHRAIELTSGDPDAGARKIQAEALDGLGHSLMAVGQVDDSVVAFREALVIRDELAAGSPDDDHFRELAIARDGLSRALAESGRTAEAIEERRHALQIWEILASNHPKDVEYRDHRVNTLNDLAWLLATDPGPDPSTRDPARAVALAEEAIRISPDHDASWNTLGVARYRAGDWTGAIEALERSALSSPDELGTAFDHYFLAMAWCQLHREDQAGEWLERGTAWAARHRPGHPTLEQFRKEAESLSRGERHGDGP